MYILAQMNDSMAVFLTIVCAIVLLFVVYLVMRSVQKEHKRYRDEVANYIEGVESKNEIIADVNAYISRAIHAEFSLLYIDIDKFSQISENFGKEEADRVIKGVANRLLEIMPSRVSLGRMKEDEFIVFTRGEFTREDVIKLAKKVVETIASPMKVYDESALSLTCSIGICHYPVHGRNFKQLFESCEIACYVCKRNGGNQYRVYSQEASENEATNMEYYYQIKEGIKNKEFDIYYQPMIDGMTEEIYAIEGLLRWNHPELGLLSPYKFINIMEQTGDINWVGQWGMETIVKEYIDIKKRINGKEFKMSLNLSPKQLSNPSLASDFQKLIKKYRNVQARNFILEIEEFSIFEKHDTIQSNLKALSDIGFNIAVDGFGLDYKALKKIEDLAVDVVKLDREYLDDESDKYLKEKFIGILVDFSRNNNRTLICEGVEDENFLARAKAMGLEIFQGYYFAKPMSNTDLEKYIVENSWKELLHKKPTIYIDKGVNTTDAILGNTDQNLKPLSEDAVREVEEAKKAIEEERLKKEALEKQRLKEEAEAEEASTNEEIDSVEKPAETVSEEVPASGEVEEVIVSEEKTETEKAQDTNDAKESNDSSEPEVLFNPESSLESNETEDLVEKVQTPKATKKASTKSSDKAKPKKAKTQNPKA